MKAKKTITEKQRLQFNRMLQALTFIDKAYQSPDQIRKQCKGVWGLHYEDSLEMSYKNIKDLARLTRKGIKYINQ